MFPSGPVPPVGGVCARGRGDGGRRVSGRGVFLRGGAGRSVGGRRVRSAGGVHVTLHVAHACDRAPVRLPLQLHGLPVGRGLPPVRHHGVSLRPLGKAAFKSHALQYYNIRFN